MSSAIATAAPMACSLDLDSPSSRLARIALLAQRHLRSEHQVGRTLHLSYPIEAGSELRSILVLERQRCPSLVFDLKEHGGGIELSILAPNIDDFAASLYEHFRGNAVSTPTRACAGGGCGCTA